MSLSVCFFSQCLVRFYANNLYCVLFSLLLVKFRIAFICIFCVSFSLYFVAVHVLLGPVRVQQNKTSGPGGRRKETPGKWKHANFQLKLISLRRFHPLRIDLLVKKSNAATNT